MTPPDTSTYFMMLLSVTGILVGKGRGERELLRTRELCKENPRMGPGGATGKPPKLASLRLEACSCDLSRELLPDNSEHVANKFVRHYNYMYRLQFLVL
jgi:hypothetical protein